MKTSKLFHLLALIVVTVALFFTPTPAKALPSSGPSFVLTSPSSYFGRLGEYTHAYVHLDLCSGSVLEPSYSVSPFSGNVGEPIKEYRVLFIKVEKINGEQHVTKVKWLSGCSGICGCTIKSKKISSCSNVSIPSRVPRSPAIPVSFKGSADITSASIYFKDLGYSLSLWLHHYDGGSRTWYGYLNTMYLPLGMHHGRVTTYVDGVRGGGCATGGFKVVNK